MKINSACFFYGKYPQVTIWRGDRYFSLSSKTYHPKDAEKFFDAFQHYAQRTDVMAFEKTEVTIDFHFDA